MALSQIGSLVPLTETLEENSSIPTVPISEGPNVIGRNVLPTTDKRLSRKHLTLTAFRDGSASLSVEGSNPVVINMGKERKKICSQEKAEIRPGCVIELIPGHHFFKYEVLGKDKHGCNEDSSRNVSSKGGKRTPELKDSSRKRAREPPQDQHAGGNTQVETEVSDVKAIHHFNIPREKLPLTFRLLRVRELPTWANTSAVSISEVIQGDILLAILSNYMVDIDWLLPACPTLAKVPHVLVVHGEGDATLDHMKRRKPANWILHKPPLPISYGTHHSKAMLLVYPRGVRVIVHTANLIYVDWNNKSQGLWMQDFPWKDQNSPKKGGGFEDDLVDYLTTLKLPEFNIKVPSVGEFTINSTFFRKFDYTDAAVRLIASVPGYHTGPNLKKWGHMKLRSVLQECTFDKDFEKAPLVYQFSSLGSLDEKWMAEFTSSMSAGSSENKKPLGLGDPLIIWPTVEDVRCSLEGYAAGNAIPSPLKNVEKEFLKKYWAKWKATHTGRCRAMPHIKTFTRYKGQKLAWLLLTSANLSKAAWGALQKNNSQLMIRSYELGVLFLPNSVRREGHVFSCTTGGSSSKDVATVSEKSELKKTIPVTLMGQGCEKTDASSEVISLPVPYELPPRPYSPEDVPWSWDRKYNKKDVYGQVWPRPVQLYAFQGMDRQKLFPIATTLQLAMEIYIDPSDGKGFPIEIDYLETVCQIKERIMINSDIPISSQTLYFKGEVLNDDDIACYLGIKEYSHVQLQIGDAQFPPRKLSLQIKVPSYAPFLVEVDGDETVKRLKEKIQERFASLPAHRMAVQVSNFELQDSVLIHESGLSSDSQVEVFIKPQLPLPVAGGGSGSGSGKLTVKVLPWDSKRKIQVEVTQSDKVKKLRSELERLQAIEGFELPDEYFFIHNQSVLEEKMTFRQNKVNQGDTIEVFRGEVTAGP